MSGFGVPDHDMPNFLWPGRRDASEDAALEALLQGAELPDDLPADLQPAGDVIAALRARASGEELAGRTLALAAFREHVGVSAETRRPRRRRPSLLTSLASAKAAVTAAVAFLTIGGLATAAYAGALPNGAQNLAHSWIGAPAAHKHHAPPAHPAASMPARHPLCIAYARAAAHGTAAQKAAAFSKLEKAAGGANKIAAYCGVVRRRHHHVRPSGCFAPMPRPSGSPHPQPSWSPRPNPSSSPRTHPSCFPAPHRNRPGPHPMIPIRHHVPHRVGTPVRTLGQPAKK
jgi:hypothetical protein